MLVGVISSRSVRSKKVRKSAVQKSSPIVFTTLLIETQKEANSVHLCQNRKSSFLSRISIFGKFNDFLVFNVIFATDNRNNYCVWVLQIFLKQKGSTQNKWTFCYLISKWSKRAKFLCSPLVKSDLDLHIDICGLADIAAAPLTKHCVVHV